MVSGGGGADIDERLTNLLLFNMPAMRSGVLNRAGYRSRQRADLDLKLRERDEELERTNLSLGKRKRAMRVAKELLGNEKYYKTVERARTVK